MDGITVYAFDYREFMRQWESIHGNMFKTMNISAKNSMTMSKSVDEARKTNKRHGTILGISKNVVSLEPKEFIVYSRAGITNTKVKKHG
jgi:hypothetical protein